VKQPPIDYIVIVAVAAAAAAEHNEVFLSMGLREATAHRRTSRPSRKSKVLIGFGLREATIYRRHRCRRTRWSSLFRVQALRAYRLSIATAFRAWLTAERFFNLFRVQALGAYDRFHRHHCSSLVDDEEVLTYFKYEHFVLTVIHRHHCSRLVWR